MAKDFEPMAKESGDAQIYSDVLKRKRVSKVVQTVDGNNFASKIRITLSVPRAVSYTHLTLPTILRV